MKSKLQLSFERRFGAKNAKALMDAARGHENTPNGTNKGNNLFRWAVLIAIGYECVGRYSKYHGITFTEDDFWGWAESHRKEFAAHRGDLDYLALFSGAYNRIMPKKSA